MTDFNDYRTVYNMIAKYVAKKSGKNAGHIYKLFARDHWLSEQELVDAFNGTVFLRTYANNNDNYSSDKYRPKSHVVEMSYKTQAIIDEHLLDSVIGTEPVYLDHGCGSGKITAEVAKVIGSSKTYGVDIYEHDLLVGRNIISLMPDINGVLPLPNNTIGVVTCLLSLHHVPQELQKKTIEELHRTMTTGSTVLIYEHDFLENPGFKLFLDAVHMTFSLYGTENESEGKDNSLSTSPKKISVPDVKWIFDTWYRSKKEWTTMFTDSGFKCQVCPVSDSYKNSQRMYMATYTK